MVATAAPCPDPSRVTSSGGAGTTDVGYVNFLNYLNAGGRAFTTHYFYNFFANEAECDPGGAGFGSSYCYGQAGLPTIGAWEGNTSQQFAPDNPNCPNDLSTLAGGSCMSIDTAIPKGVVLTIRASPGAKCVTCQPPIPGPRLTAL